MSSAKKLMGTTAVGGALAIEDVFSTYLYTGTNATQSIVNGIDLAGEGGLVWTKNRDGLATELDHQLMDSEQGAFRYVLESSNTNAAFDYGASIITPQADGFDLSSASRVNQSGKTYASWTFRKAPRFFDVVTWTGNGTYPRSLSHNLGVAPGCVIIKSTSFTYNWQVWHKNIGSPVGSGYLRLNTTDSVLNSTTNYFDATDTSFTINTTSPTDVSNGNGQTYVAYLFAHDPLGPSGDGSDGLIACGSYSDASATTVNLGWEPQWIIIKRTDTTGNWGLIHSMSGWTASGDDRYVKPNLSDTEQATTWLELNSTGFKTNGYGGNYIYIAIRRGPMRQPTSGTEVFDADAYVGNSTANRLISTGFPIDLAIIANRSNDGLRSSVWDRMRGYKHYLTSSSTAVEQTASTEEVYFDQNDGYRLSASTFQGHVNFSGYGAYIGFAFKRAPGFFDVVAYTGTGSARTVSHNLGVAPEMMWVKARESAGGANRNWAVYLSALGAGQQMWLNTTDAAFASSTIWANTAPTETSFSVSTNVNTNYSNVKYIAYLFATLPGVSKVGSYTGNGTSQTINCGFTSGARFILIKRTDSTGDWYVWDTARGIVAANDPHLSLNTISAEVTTDDSVDPDSSGFIVNQVAATNINVSSASYIFYAIA